ncbi:MAG: hypothetical protein HWE27_18835 [Gammaproteobacteria bacterium]|nr:hypothetical protein [Gammaproteobacteria bacterium]
MTLIVSLAIVCFVLSVNAQDNRDNQSGSSNPKLADVNAKYSDWVSDNKAYSTDLEFSDQVAIFAGRQAKEESAALNDLLTYIAQDNQLKAEELDLLLELINLNDDKWLTYLFQSKLYAEIDPVSEKSKIIIHSFLNEFSP